MRVVALLVLASCTFDSAVPPAAIVCTSQAQCPRTMVCSARSGLCAKPETDPPGPINDLAQVFERTTIDSMVLTFTAPGDDGFVPNTAASAYALSFEDGDGGVRTVGLTQKPQSAYHTETVTVTGLQRGQLGVVRVVAIDDLDNESLSNPVEFEVAGAACPLDGGLAVAAGPLVVNTRRQLVPLIGCDVVDGPLTISDSDCSLENLETLVSLKAVTNQLIVTANRLCPREDLTLSGLESVASMRLDALPGSVYRLPAARTIIELDFTESPTLTGVDLPVIQRLDSYSIYACPRFDACALQAYLCTRGIHPVLSRQCDGGVIDTQRFDAGDGC